MTLILSVMLSDSPHPAEADPAKIAVLPQPGSLTAGDGAFTISPDTQIVTNKATQASGTMLASWLAPATGYMLEVREGKDADNTIRLRLDDSLRHLGNEGYVLEVMPRRVTIRAPRQAG